MQTNNMNQMRVVLWTAAVLLQFASVICSDQDGLYATVIVTGYLNPSYRYEGTIPHCNNDFKYKIDTELKRVPVEPHNREHICNPIIRVTFRSAPGQKLEDSRSMADVNGKEIIEDIMKKNDAQINELCQDMYHSSPHNYDYDGFKLFENETLLRLADKKHLLKEEYSWDLDIHTDVIIELPVQVNCSESDASGNSKSIFGAITMLFSVPFIILTIVVYILIPSLWTLHGKSLCCYLLGLYFGYSILSAFNFMPMDSISEFNCSFWGFFAYFSFMASFCWMSVISFDLFYNIRAPHERFNEKKRFFLYSVCAWGLTFVFLAFTYCAQQATFIPDRWKPAFGRIEFCWLNVKYGWSALIYFYGPIIIIIGFNITMFILTALQMSHMMERYDSQKNLHTEEDRFRIFLRLFIVMGVTWSMEIVSYFLGTTWDKLFYVTYICNGIQGLLIFTLFVLKKKIKEYIPNSAFDLHLNNNETCKPLMENSDNIIE